MKTINFVKYQGIGNDFIIIDSRSNDLYDLFIISDKEIVKRLCDRRYGIGADGVILLMNSNSGADARMEIFNSDGSTAEMCGNGIRCLVNYIKEFTELDLDDNCIIQTLIGNLSAHISNTGNVKIDMGNPVFTPSKIPTKLQLNDKHIPSGNIDIENTNLKVYCASMGNPHVITYVKDIESIPLELWGKSLENNNNFPNKTNVHFVQILNRKKLCIKIWERGCGPTLACGTGACAVLAISSRLNLCDDEVEISLPGGNLEITWPSKNGSIYMSGPADFVFKGTIDLL